MLANAPFGHCPKCLLELGFGPDREEPEVLSQPRPGRERGFADYELLEQIGRGGMGVIYKARQRALNRLVALKMISAGEFASPMLIQRFHLEAEAAANLHHPNIVPIYETGEHEGQHFFSMELIDGAGLDRYITTAGFWFEQTPGKDKTSLRARHEQIARIMAKVARAVDYAHQHGVLHRDIKPSNVVVDRQGEPHLTDFGVAKVIGHAGSSLTASGMIMGTPSYMAPEQAAGQGKRVTTAADIYSLGAILYAMLTGQPPFRAETPVQTLKQVVEQEPKHPTTFSEGVDRDLANICMKCLEKEPQGRYRSAAALADDLERWLRKEPIHARPVKTVERVWRWCRRNPKVAALVGSIAAMLVVVSIISTLVAIHIQRLNDSIQNSNLRLRDEVLENLVKLYSDPNTTSYTIKAEVRHALVGRSRVPDVAGKPLELTFVDYVYGHPTNILNIFAPILEALEWDLARRLQQPVLIHLRMLQSYDLGYDDLETDKKTFGRVGPSSLSQLLDKGTGVELVAMQDQKRPLTLALFTRTNSALAHAKQQQPDLSLVSLFANRSMAFGNSNSTTGNFVPRWFLADNGVFATNLSRYLNLKNPAEVIDAVRSNRFDVGAVNWEILRDKPDLLVVAQFEVADLGRCWVAGRGLDRQIFTAVRESLLGMTNPAIIGKIESELDGFKVVDEEALARLREIMRGAGAFDSRNQQK